jgi:hypothetical protein
MLVNSTIERGCGTRKKGGLYACVSVSDGGDTPIEQFIVDPVLPWTHGPFQGGIVSFNASLDVYDLVMWVGAEYYPYVPDFIEEGRVHGFSKRVPTTMDGLNQLNERSRLILVHPKAGFDHRIHLRHQDPTPWAGVCPNIQRPDPSASGECNHPIESDHTTTNCTFSLWDLSGHIKCNTKGHTVSTLNRHHLSIPDGRERDTVLHNPVNIGRVKTPSVIYEVLNITDNYHPGDGDNVDIGWYPAIFCVLPLTHFEYVTSDHGGSVRTVPAHIADNLGENITRTFSTLT